MFDVLNLSGIILDPYNRLKLRSDMLLPITFFASRRTPWNY